MTALEPLERPLAASATQPGWQELPSRYFVEVPVADGVLNVATVGEGSALFLLHGWTLDHRIWAPQWNALGQDFRLFIPDRRGFGQSTARPDLQAESADIFAIADAMGLDHFGVVGMSQAGVIALNLALTDPGRVRAVATLGSPLAGTVPGGDNFDRDRWAEMVTRGDIAQVRREWSKHPLMQSANAGLQHLLDAIVGNYDGRDLVAPSSLPQLAAEDIAAIDVPILALAGARDSAWRQSVARFIGDKAPAGSYCSIAEAGHLANICQPDAFNRRIADFFRHFLN